MKDQLRLVAIAAIVIIVLIAAWFIISYNSLVGLKQSATAQWAQVESQYQRRADLIPNLVASVTGYMQFERSLLENITYYRSQWAQAGNANQKIAAATQLDSAISRLLVVYENYPDLKSDQTVARLMDELAGTENRIAVERMRYNEAVKSYDTAISYFPTNMVANSFGFTSMDYFEAQQGADQVPKVNLAP